MRTTSDITGSVYEAEDCVFFRNVYQSAFYIKNGAKLIDLFVDSSTKLVFVFLKEDHRKLIKLWINNKMVNDEERRKDF